MLVRVFHKVQDIIQEPACTPRARCLLQDVLDLRAGGWQDTRPKRIEGLMMLSEVAGGGATPTHQLRVQILLLLLQLQQATPKATPKAQSPTFDRQEFQDELTKVFR